MTYQSPSPAWSSFALAEPAVVHDEAIDADGGGFFGEGHLTGFTDVELGGFPGVVNYGARLGVWRLRQDVSDFEMMEQARGTAEAVIGIACVKNGSFEMLAGIQLVAKIEWIEAASDADGVKLGVFDGEAPGAGPGEGAEPDFAVLFAGVGRTCVELLSSREIANQGLA